MPEFVVTLLSEMIVAGDVTVEAADMASAIEAAKTDAARASWPVDQCGERMRSDGPFAASYVMNRETGEEDWPDESCTDPLHDAARDLLEALKLAAERLALCNYEGEEDGTLASIDAAIAKAEGR